MYRPQSAHTANGTHRIHRMQSSNDGAPVYPTKQPLFPPPGRISQHKFQSHTQQTENSIMGRLLFCARATTRSFASCVVRARCIFIPSTREGEEFSLHRTCLSAADQIQLKFNISCKYLKISSGASNWLASPAHWMSPLARHQKNLIKRIWVRRFALHFSELVFLSFCVTLRWNNKYIERAAQRLTFYALW